MAGKRNEIIFFCFMMLFLKVDKINSFCIQRVLAHSSFIFTERSEVIRILMEANLVGFTSIYLHFNGMDFYVPKVLAFLTAGNRVNTFSQQV